MKIPKIKLYKLRIPIILSVLVCIAIKPMILFSLSEEHHWEWHERSGLNSQAKLLYTNIATYITKLEESNNKAIPAGVYTGIIKNDTDHHISTDDILYNGTAEDIENFLCLFQGYSKEEYYFFIIEDTYPEQIYLSRHKSLKEYSDVLLKRYEKNGVSETVWIGGNVLGGYPREVSYYDYNKMPEPCCSEENRLNIKYNLIGTFVAIRFISSVYISALLPVWVIYLLICTVISRKNK